MEGSTPDSPVNSHTTAEQNFITIFKRLEASRGLSATAEPCATRNVHTSATNGCRRLLA